MRTFLDKKLRSRVERLGKARCSVCNYPFPDALSVHHKVPVELGGRDTLANLVLVCQNCHVLAHVLSRKRYRTRVLESDF